MMTRSPILPRSAFATRLAAAGLALALAFGGAVPAGAQSSAIKIIVNDRPITSMDINGRAKLLQLANKLAPGAAQKAAIEELIDDSLRIAEAERRGVKIPAEAVDGAVAEIAGRSKMSAAQFAQALGQAGVPIGTLKDRIRAQMIWTRLVRAKVQQNLKTEQNDLIAQMRRQEKPTDAVTAEDYVLQRVVLTLPGKPSADLVARRRKEAEALRGRFKGCEQGIAYAKSLKEVAVLNVGRKLASEVPPNFREALKETPEGGLTKPDLSNQGVEMYAVCEKITVKGENALATGVDAETMSEQGKTVSESLTRELRQRANIVYR